MTEDMAETRTFADRFKELKALRGNPTYEEIGTALGLESMRGQGAKNWASGKNKPSRDNLVRLAAYLKTTVEWLETGSGARDLVAGETEPLTLESLARRVEALERDKSTLQHEVRQLAAELSQQRVRRRRSAD